jgi:hypothetical protein
MLASLASSANKGRARGKPATAPAQGAPRASRNNTSFPVEATARLRQLHTRYLAALADAEDPEHGWAGLLRYYQYTVRAVFASPDFGIGSDAAGTAGARGLLCYHVMGLGKTRLAVAVALTLWDVRPVVVLLPRSLRENFEKTVREVMTVLGRAPDDAELRTALARFTFVSMDAYNAAEQMARAGVGKPLAGGPGAALSAAGGLDGKLLIVDEAHNFFRAIINGGPETNARRNYDMIMGARNLRILFLTGTPASKDPFELVPCFNMLAGFDLFPTQYEVFYELYVDKGANAVKNRSHFANRIVGLVSHVSTGRSTEPVEDGAPARPAQQFDLPRLWRLTADLPVVDVPASAFAAVLRDRTWDGPLGPATVSPVAVVMEPARYPRENSRIATADLKYPVILAPTDDGAPVSVIDGVHRIARAVLLDGAPTVRAVYPSPEIIKSCYLGENTNRVVRAARATGWFPEERPTIVERVEMGPEQYRRYLLAREKENAEGGGGGIGGLGPALSSGPLSLPGAEKKAMRSYFVHSRSFGNYVAPRGATGVVPLTELKDANAPKLALIAQRARDAAGPVLAYSQFVENGLSPLTRYLERVGFLAWGAKPEDITSVIETVENVTESRAATEGGGESEGYVKNVAAAHALLEGKYARAYTADEGKRILRLAGQRQPPPSPWYDPGAPALPYRKDRERAAADLFNLHHGQRKLFVGELEALTAMLSEALSTPPKSTKKLVVVYAGAAPGHHIPRLAQLFPMLEWHLIDPGAFEMRGPPADLHRIHTYREYFTDASAAEWRDRCDIFISDIRLNPPADAPDAEQQARTGWSPSFEKQVAIDMAAQDRWTSTIRPRVGASLKWRPPYIDANSKETMTPVDSLRGRVLIQVWPPRSSTEGRLIITGADAAAGERMQFDPVHYESACAQRNNIDRPWATYAAHGCAADCAAAVPGFDYCYDCVREAGAWADYIAYCSRVGKAAPTVSVLMNKLTDNIHQRLDGGSRVPLAEVERAAAGRKGPRLHGFRPDLPAASRLALALGVGPSRPTAMGGAEDSPPRYAVVSGEVPTEERARIVAAFNSPENAHGEVIKAILVSKTGAEGLDLKWIRETHQLEPYWDRARDDQVRARAVRLGSHDGLPPAEREVQPYIYVAVANRGIWDAMPRAAREPASIDEVFYERATRRYELNKAFRTVLAEACLECDLFGYAHTTSNTGAASSQAFACRVCVPTNSALWLPDPAADARMPDACELQSARDIEATPLTVDGRVYYFEPDPASGHGFAFYEERPELGAYAPVDPSDSRLPQLVKAALAATA